MRIHFFLHVPFETSADIGLWAHQRGHQVRQTHWYAGGNPPSADEYDLLVILGGPMSVHDVQEHSWLAEEKAALGAAMEADKAVLGVCLGAQLLAEALGAEVAPHSRREIGWHEIVLTKHGRECELLAEWPPTAEVFHWHGDRFEIPPGAVRLAGSEACDNQTFLHGDRAVGMQFHLEYTRQSIEDMLVHCGEELDDSRWVQSAEEMLADASRIDRTRELLWPFLDALARRSAESG